MTIYKDYQICYLEFTSKTPASIDMISDDLIWILNSLTTPCKPPNPPTSLTGSQAARSEPVQWSHPPIYGQPLRFSWALVWSQQLDCFHGFLMVQPISKRASIPGLATVLLACNISMAVWQRAEACSCFIYSFLLQHTGNNIFQGNLQAAHVYVKST